VNRPKLGIVVTHPIQYQVPLYRCLTERSVVEPLVFYLTDHGVTESFDPGFGRPVRFDVPLLDGYAYRMVPGRGLGSGRPWDAFAPSLPALIRRSGVDAVLVHGYNLLSHWLAYATAVGTGVPYLVRCESRLDMGITRGAKAAAKHALIRPLVRHAGGCLAIGSRNRAFYQGYGARQDQVFFAPYSVDDGHFREAGAEGRARRAAMLAGLGLDPGVPLVLFAAKLQPWKRPADVVMALDKLNHERGRPANLVVIGDGPLRPALGELAASRPWMRLLGFVNQSEVARWCGAADLFVLPSSREPWGVAVNEAMAAGAVPVVSDAVGCAPDLVTPDVGWVYPAGDTAALARALGEGCQPGALVRRRAAAQRRAAEYGVAATATGIEAAVTAALAARLR
jgi:glycosyltransferase involved in cell wall biosynthesis